MVPSLDNELMHISVRLIVHPEEATNENHLLYIEKLTSHLSRKWSVAKADFDAKEYHYIWDFHDYKPPNLMTFNTLPLGVKVRLTIK